jgi:hypothetical protein
MKLLRTTAGISLTLVAGLVLAGCSSTPDETTAPVAEGDVSTDFREPQNQKPIDPNAGGYVDAGDTSRQDGPKEVKYITEDVESTNPVTGEEDTKDETTIFKVTATTVTKAAGAASSKVYALGLNENDELVPQEKTLDEVDTYTIQLQLEYVSGYDKPISPSVAPLFYPITNSGATTAISSSNANTAVNNTTTSVTITAVTKAGSPAPVGVRYMQFNDEVEDLISPVIDVFPTDLATAKPKTDEATE